VYGAGDPKAVLASANDEKEMLGGPRPDRSIEPGIAISRRTLADLSDMRLIVKIELSATPKFLTLRVHVANAL